MTPRRIVYLRKAQHDLLEIVSYIRSDSPSSTDRLLEDIDRGVSRLAAFPQSGLRPRDPLLRARGYRLVIVQDYLIFYLSKGRQVQIRRVIHGKRRYDFLV